MLGTATIVLALVAPTLFVDEGAGSWAPWAATAAAVVAAVLFVLRERSARYPLLDLELVARPLVSSGLAFKAAAGLATAGLGYLVTLQLQLDWGWPPALAALGMLPQVVVLVAGGAFVSPFVQRVGLERAAWISAAAVVAGLAVYGLLGRFGYVWVAVALVLVAAGMRVVGVVAGVNVLRGLPENRTTIGAALVDTATEVTSGAGIAVTGTILAALFTGDIADVALERAADRAVPGGGHDRGRHAHRRRRGARRLGNRPLAARPGLVVTRSAADAELVALGVAVDDLADAVVVGLPIGGLDAARGDPGDAFVQVLDEQRVHGEARTLGPLHDVDRAVRGDLPQDLGVVHYERRRGAEQLLVPGKRTGEVAHGDPGEEFDGHSTSNPLAFTAPGLSTVTTRPGSSPAPH